MIFKVQSFKFFILDTIFYTTPNKDAGIIFKDMFKLKPDLYSLIKENKSKKMISTFKTILPDREEGLITIKPIKFNDFNTTWYSCVILPSDKIFASFNFQKNIYFFGFFAIFIFFIVISAIFVNKVITRRILNTSKLISEVSKGNFDVKVKEDLSLDEIGILNKIAIKLSEDMKNLVSNLKQKEAILTQQNIELERANRFKDAFLATMSHELRTPLNAIIGFNSLMENQFYGKLNEKQMEYTTIIRNSSLHLLTFIDDLLDMARIDANDLCLNKESIDCDKCKSEIMDIMKIQFEQKGVELIWLPSNNVITVWADKRKLRQIMINLLSNALKFTPAKGKVTIKVEQLNSNSIKVFIIDTGKGIKKEEQEKIFTRFYKTNEAITSVSGGTGIGLALCKRFVELHDGEIGFESDQDKGSTFWFTLPIKSPKD